MKFELLALVLLFGVAASAPGLAGRRSSTRYVCIEGLCHALESDGAEPRNSPFFRSLADCRVSCLGRPKLPDFRPSPVRPEFPKKIHDDYRPSPVRPEFPGKIHDDYRPSPGFPGKIHLPN
ncbi:hypothetical protein ISCGN_028979 [Ixodes scapularis]